MADTFRITGQWSTSPILGTSSAIPAFDAPIDEIVQIIRKNTDDLTLTVDTPVVVSLGGLTNVHVLVIKTIGGKIQLRVTSADGSTQAFPVDTFLMLITQSVPITAIDVTRVANTETQVHVFMGEIS